MTETPVSAAFEPVEVDLVEGKRYFFCTCGRSSKQPYCDGSHKETGFEPLMFESHKTGKSWLCQCKHTSSAPFCDGSHNKIKPKAEE